MYFKLKNLLTLLSCIALLSSCINTTDEVWIESDGTGRIESVNDLSGLYPFMMMGLQQQTETEDGEDEKGSTYEAMMKSLFMAPEVDTTIAFSSFMESAAADKGQTLDQMMAEMEAEMKADATMPEDQKEALFGMVESFLNMEMRLQTSQEKQMFKTTNLQNFANITELSSLGETMMELMPLMSGDGGMPAEAASGLDQFFNGLTRMEINGNTLRIRRAGMDFSSLGDEAAQSIGMAKMFLGSHPYRLTIHLPGKVKKISSDRVKKLDKTTVQLEIPLDELFDPEMRLDAEITFKGLKK